MTITNNFRSYFFHTYLKNQQWDDFTGLSNNLKNPLAVQTFEMANSLLNSS